MFEEECGYTLQNGESRCDRRVENALHTTLRVHEYLRSCYLVSELYEVIDKSNRAVKLCSAYHSKQELIAIAKFILPLNHTAAKATFSRFERVKLIRVLLVATQSEPMEINVHQ